MEKLITNLFKIMRRKIKQIEEFHYANWMDFRANLVLPSLSKLIEFIRNNEGNYMATL